MESRSQAMANVKGALLVAVVKALRANREAAVAVLTEPLRPYLDRQVLPATWYPEEDFHELLAALIELIPPSDKDPWVYVGEVAAEAHFVGVYAALVVKGNPSTTLQRFEVIWRLNHDSGRLRSSRNGEGEARIEIRDYLNGSDGYARANSAYFRRLLELSGAAEVTVRTIGGSGWTGRFELTWTEPPSAARG